MDESKKDRAFYTADPSVRGKMTPDSQIAVRGNW